MKSGILKTGIIGLAALAAIFIGKKAASSKGVKENLKNLSLKKNKIEPEKINFC
ncbi:MAG: hypothetical protein HW421_2435 [Ignavibacteria bacterium]|nr:hypothetical protein [Ignavibacteria bacterium]